MPDYMKDILNKLARRYPEFADYELKELVEGACTYKQALAMMQAALECNTKPVEQ